MATSHPEDDSYDAFANAYDAFVRINYAELSQLVKISGIGRKSALAILHARYTSGNITEYSLPCILPVRTTQQMLDMIDFEPDPMLDAEDEDGSQEETQEETPVVTRELRDKQVAMEHIERFQRSLDVARRVVNDPDTDESISQMRPQPVIHSDPGPVRDVSHPGRQEDMSMPALESCSLSYDLNKKTPSHDNKESQGAIIYKEFLFEELQRMNTPEREVLESRQRRQGGVGVSDTTNSERVREEPCSQQVIDHPRVQGEQSRNLRDQDQSRNDEQSQTHNHSSDQTDKSCYPQDRSQPQSRDNEYSKPQSRDEFGTSRSRDDLNKPKSRVDEGSEQRIRDDESGYQRDGTHKQIRDRDDADLYQRDNGSKKRDQCDSDQSRYPRDRDQSLEPRDLEQSREQRNRDSKIPDQRDRDQSRYPRDRDQSMEARDRERKLRDRDQSPYQRDRDQSSKPQEHDSRLSRHRDGDRSRYQRDRDQSRETRGQFDNSKDTDKSFRYPRDITRSPSRAVEREVNTYYKGETTKPRYYQDESRSPARGILHRPSQDRSRGRSPSFSPSRRLSRSPSCTSRLSGTPKSLTWRDRLSNQMQSSRLSSDRDRLSYSDLDVSPSPSWPRDMYKPSLSSRLSSDRDRHGYSARDVSPSPSWTRDMHTPTSQRSSTRSSDDKRSSRDLLKSIPKSLSFDGKGNWDTFRQRFIEFADMSDLSDRDAKTVLCWSLRGKAADFYAVIEGRDNMDCMELMRRFTNRFGFQELRQTAYARFTHATQETDESLEDWSDRLLTLAQRGFKNLPQDHMDEQIIWRFCQGLHDKEAGEHTINKDPDTLDQAMEQVRWYQYNHQVFYPGKTPARRTSTRDLADERVKVAAVQETPPNEELKSMFGDLQSNLATQFETLAKTLGSLVQAQVPAPPMGRGMSYGRGRGEGGRGRGRCYRCGNLGHFRVDCKVALPENYQGSDTRATVRPEKKE
jgi:hypothetical protein